MNKLAMLMLIALTATLTFAQDRQYEVTITNVTQMQILSPPVVIAHDGTYALFQLGEGASEGLVAMAEDGNAALVRDEALGHSAVSDVQISAGPVMPGQSVTVRIGATDHSDTITVAGMLVTTNDAFFAADVRLPGFFNFKQSFWSPSVLAPVYDAGSEANTEECAHIPGPPCGNGGVRVTEGAEGYVLPHSGIHGIGDIAASSYDWGHGAAVIRVRSMN